MRFLLLAALTAAAASAQPSNWTMPSPGSTSLLVAERPFVSEQPGDGVFDNSDFGAVTSAWRLTVNQPLGPVRASVDLPFAFVTIDENLVDDDNTIGAALGNLGIGFELPLVVAPVRLGAYVRIPTSTESENVSQIGGRVGGDAAAAIGALAGYEQPGLYAKKAVTVAGMVEARPRLAAVPGLSFRVRAVPQVLAATTDNSSVGDNEVFVGYAAQAFFQAGPGRVGGGLSGISSLSGDADQSNALGAGLLGQIDLGAIRLGASARLPLTGGASDVLDGVVGVSLTFEN